MTEKLLLAGKLDPSDSSFFEIWEVWGKLKYMMRDIVYLYKIFICETHSRIIDSFTIACQQDK